jgi:hypothetical protein
VDSNTFIGNADDRHFFPVALRTVKPGTAANVIGYEKEGQFFASRISLGAAEVVGVEQNKGTDKR